MAIDENGSNVRNTYGTAKQEQKDELEYYLSR
jgi:hypothetical protein